MSQAMPHYSGTRDENTTTARPKLLRRPAQFSAPTDAPGSTEIVLHPTLSLPTPIESTPAPPARSWQDDGRFGFLMLAIVLVTNLVLMAWLPHLHQPTKATAASVGTVNSIMPTATGGNTPAPAITTYARPSDAVNPPRIISVHQLSPVADGFNFAPTRHVLDESTEDSDQ